MLRTLCRGSRPPTPPPPAPPPPPPRQPTPPKAFALPFLIWKPSTTCRLLLRSQVRLGVVVWEAALDQPLGAYVQRYAEQMQAVVGNPSLNVVVVCNKTDLTPCPIPQLSELRESQPFIAVSAERGTNLRHFWGMVQPTLSKPPSRTASTAGPADETSTAASTQGGLAERRLDSSGLLRR